MRAKFVEKLDTVRSIYSEKAISQAIIVHLYLLALYEAEYLFHRQITHCGFPVGNEKKPTITPKTQQNSTISPFTKWEPGWHIPSGANLSEAEKVRLGGAVSWFDSLTKSPSKEWRCLACNFHSTNVYSGWEKTHCML